ncbi:vacuolar amino acid transporter, putative [Pediculus humanus corporis]|uniref:Vacuolar amino acid transporter, putative n=1 Tax=Pediculus humanus subsp. corporis TaxID=121224 RepID=E0VFI9_PEDHC|nr:vacuolar amino acid transporter, putative [Pediculus humanus corporis]EEB12145.1 vacuolar amino acid transporter, putative [Pediculus humanus corporis]
MAGSAGHIMNLANSIIGVGLLAMPFCFKQCGITLAIIMLFLSSAISRTACRFLVRSSAMCRKRNIEYLAFYTFGSSGKLLVELGIIGFMMGTCVAFFVVMGDLGPAIISKMFHLNNNSTLRTSVLLGIGFFVILPLGLLRNIESLVTISTATIGFYFLFILKIFIESSHHLLAGDWWNYVYFWKPEGVLQCIPIFAMSLSCQTQLFEIYDSLPSPSVEKMNYVVKAALNLCTAVYASVGILGYIAYCKGTFTGNILLSFTPSLSSELFKLGFVMSIAVSFPLVIFPCRASLYSLIFKRISIHHESGQTSSHIPDSRFKWLTIVIVTVSLITGLLIPSIELVLGFVGSTIGIAICVIFPSLSFLNLNTRDTNDQMIAKFTVVMGVIIMIVGTFGNLFAAIESPPVNLENKPIKFDNLPQPKIFSKNEMSIDGLKKISKEANVMLPKIEDFEKLKLRDQDTIIDISKIQQKESQRKEPPVPVAPMPEIKENRKAVIPPVKIIKINDDIDNSKKFSSEIKKIENFPKEKLNENINRDAIEKENREMMEMEKEKRAEDDKKERDILKKLKEHEDEQKKLLIEQKKILYEMKKQKKLNDIIKQKSILITPESIVKTIQLDKSKEKKLLYEKKILNDKEDDDNRVVESLARDKRSLPIEESTTKKENVEECSKEDNDRYNKTENTSIKKDFENGIKNDDNEGKNSKISLDVIKKSEHLSDVNVLTDKKSEISNVLENVKLTDSLQVGGKKRDLKSIKDSIDN